MAAFKRMLQVGIKVENCLMRYRALKAHSTSSSSSSKEISQKKMRSHPGHEAVDFRDDFAGRIDATDDHTDYCIAKFSAAMAKMKKDTNDLSKKYDEAINRRIENRGFCAGAVVVLLVNLGVVAVYKDKV